MKLGDQQRKFTLMIASLIIWAYREGYEITVGDFWAHDRHKDGSFHYKRLAADLNLFKDGVYLTEAEDHRPLGEEWERMGGTWGFHFGNKDANHYSLGE
jgi:hypothetical protein